MRASNLSRQDIDHVGAGECLRHAGFFVPNNLACPSVRGSYSANGQVESFP